MDAIARWLDGNTTGALLPFPLLSDSTPAFSLFSLFQEYLLGRVLHISAINLDVKGELVRALESLGTSMEVASEQEQDPALGNGGLG